MGCLSLLEEGKVLSYQNVTYQNQNYANQNQKVPIQYQPAYAQFLNPKLFDFDPNFLKGYNNIEKIKLDNAEYEGQMKDGKRNGKGIMKWANGAIYEGEFKDDLVSMKGNGKIMAGMEKEK